MSEHPLQNPFFQEVREILTQARGNAVRAVNSAMVEAYWQIGKRIVEEEQGGEEKARYGRKLIEGLSMQLTAEFGKGFSVANLRNMRQFYLSCPEKGIRYTLSSELSWTHHHALGRFCPGKGNSLRNVYRIELEPNPAPSGLNIAAQGNALGS